MVESVVECCHTVAGGGGKEGGNLSPRNLYDKMHCSCKCNGKRFFGFFNCYGGGFDSQDVHMSSDRHSFDDDETLSSVSQVTVQQQTYPEKQEHNRAITRPCSCAWLLVRRKTQRE